MSRRARTALAWTALVAAYGLAVAAVWTADRMDLGGRLGGTAFLTLCVAGVVALSVLD